MATFNWIPLEQNKPAQPGTYLTRRDLRVERGRYGVKKTFMHIEPAYFDGQRFELPVQPTHYREMPGRVG